jgi:TusE/DsrC/DsvC family sulfur relay protein
MTQSVPTYVECDGEGFFVDPRQWTPEMAPGIARASGIARLTARHWQVIGFMRATYLQTGTEPSIPAVGRAAGISIDELNRLFPDWPANLAAKIAGLPKPSDAVTVRNW